MRYWGKCRRHNMIIEMISNKETKSLRDDSIISPFQGSAVLSDFDFYNNPIPSGLKPMTNPKDSHVCRMKHCGFDTTPSGSHNSSVSSCYKHEIPPGLKSMMNPSDSHVCRMKRCGFDSPLLGCIIRTYLYFINIPSLRD